MDIISLEDQKILEEFLYRIIHYTDVGYSLCGDKPISIETFPNVTKTPLKCAVGIICDCQGYSGYALLHKGWKTWIRYANKFISHKFIIRYSQEYNTLIFINIPATKRVIEENLELFQKYSNTQTIDEILAEICFPKNGEYLFKHNMMLLGILLGYGRNNAIAFEQHRLIKKLKPLNLEDGDLDLNFFSNPGLMIISDGTNEEENRKIRKSFKEAKRKIDTNFREGCCLLTFLRLYTSPSTFAEINENYK